MEKRREITIGITQAESKRALALEAHLGRIFGIVFDKEGRGLHPLEMNQADILLCSASLRTLFFDDSGSSILLDFLTQHSINLELETFETDLAMLFFAQVEPKDSGHACDLCLKLLFDQKMREYCELNKATSLLLVGGKATAYTSLEKQPEVWRPSLMESEKNNIYVGFSDQGPLQRCTITRKRIPISEWGNVRLGYLKGIPIRRRTIICYVANKLGGVHYDSSRLPLNDLEKSEFKILVQAYDWEKQAIMHAGLVAVAIACIEIATHPNVAEVLKGVKKFNHERQSRLLRGESPLWEEPI